MLNVYSGNVTTDGNGEASVALPDYFEALNQDACYQSTVIGQFAQAIVAQEIANNQFTIKTDQPGVKVSWQVTGTRQDPWAVANRIAVEAKKAAEEKGRYLHPELWGQPEEARIHGSAQRENQRGRIREDQLRRVKSADAGTGKAARRTAAAGAAAGRSCRPWRTTEPDDRGQAAGRAASSRRATEDRPRPT